jgi:hypothetical protein
MDNVKTLMEAFEDGVVKGRQQNKVKADIKGIWSLVSSKFADPKFQVIANADAKHLQITFSQHGGQIDPIDMFKAPMISVRENGDGTFCVNEGGQNMGNSYTMAETVMAMGVFYGRNSKPTR